MKVHEKNIVVTGGGSGMGRELVLQLLKRGARVAAVDINAATLSETASLAAVPAERLATLTTNIAERAAVEGLFAEVVARFGHVDAVINCAGIIQPFVRLKDLEWSAIDRVLGVNLYGTLFMTKVFLPHLLQRPEAHIVNIASMGGFLPVPGQTIYGASKAAVKLMTEGLHSELMGTQVHVTVVFPGAIATNIAANSGITAMPGGIDAKKSPIKMTAADRAAKEILDGMESNAYRVLVGPDAKLMDALCRLSPERAAAFIYKQMRSLLP